MSITAKAVPTAARMATLPKHFPSAFMHFENACYAFAAHLSEDYSGAYWQFVELSNGGFFMYPEQPTVNASANYTEGELTGEGFGIAVCLMVYSNLSFQLQGAARETMANNYYLLREYLYDAWGLEHREDSALITRLID